LHRILLEAVPESIVPPEIDNAQVLGRPVQPGRVYPTSYVTHEELLSVAPPNSRWFVVIRDLRDTLVSAYYSLKFSHPVIDPEVADWRDGLGQLTSERGLLAVMDLWLDLCARIQDSWLRAREPMIRYEDLLEDDLAILEPVLLDRCALPVAPERLREAILANRFARVAGGRRRGEEDRMAHERKGVAGDWRRHFTPNVKAAFKARFGDLLIETGYARDFDW
jgi:lipopolysaccharide transport system ATP-binding protein